MRHAVESGQNPLITDYLYAPEGSTLIGATLNPFNGFATNPLCDYYYTLYATGGGTILFACKACMDPQPLFFLERHTLLALGMTDLALLPIPLVATATMRQLPPLSRMRSPPSEE